MKHYISILLLVCCIHSFSQENVLHFNNTPLKNVLEKLEKTFELKFSYEDSSIKNKYFSSKGHHNNLNIILSEIQKKTDLIFEKINSRYFIIRKKQQGKYKSICAYIFDKTTSESLEKTEIINISQGTGTTTNKNGYFELNNVSPKDSVSIHYLGFRTIKISALEFLDNKCLKIGLQPTNEQLSEVVISEYITEGITQVNDGAINILPRSLEILPGLTEPDVLESLQSLPGIQSPNETASGLHIRGGTPDQNLILWDGIKIYHSGHFFGTISAFNPYITDEIKVYKNGSKAKYGNRIAATIDISSEKNIPEKINGGFGLNMTHADAFLKAPLFHNKVGVITSFRRSYTDAINTFTYQKFTKKVFQNSRISKDENQLGVEANETNNDFYFSDFNIKVLANISNNDKLTLSSLFVKNKLSYSALFTDEDFSDTTNDDLEIKNSGFQISWNRDWSNKFQHNIGINTSNYNLNYKGVNEFDQIGFINDTKNNKVKELEIELSSNYNFNIKNSLEIGYQYTTNDVSFLLENSMSYLPEYDYSFEDKNLNITHGIFAEYKYHEPKKLNINIGVRANTFSITDDFFLEPRISLEVPFNNNLKILASGEIKNQSISQILEFITSDFGLENQVWALADNENFPVLNSQQLGLGFNYNKNSWSFNIDGYYKKIKGISSFTRGFSTNTGGFSNGNSINYGVDFLIKRSIKNYRTWISYTLARSDFQFDELNSGNKFAGNFDIRHSFNWSHTYKLNRFKFSLGYKFRQGRPFTEALGLINEEDFIDIEFGKVNTAKLPNYSRLDFSTTYSFNFSKTSNWKGKIGMSILNVLDSKNILNKSYLISQNANGDDFELIETNQNALGFTPNIVFRLTF